MASNGNFIMENETHKFVDIGSDMAAFNVNEASDAESTVYVKHGQYFIPINRVILQNDQENLEQYIINDPDEDLEVVENIQEVIGQPIIYYSGDLTDQSECLEDLGDSCDSVHIESNTVGSDNTIVKLETNFSHYENEQINNEIMESDFIQFDDNTGSEKIIITAEQSQPQYQYAILKDGRLHLQTVDVADASNCDLQSNHESQELQEKLQAFQHCITLEDQPTSVVALDISKITGKNLITGQTVTLGNYIENLQKRIAAIDASTKCKSSTDSENEIPSKKRKINSDSIINKMVVVGKTSNGKKIIGKIVHVEAGQKKSYIPNNTDCETDDKVLINNSKQNVPISSEIIENTTDSNSIGDSHLINDSLLLNYNNKDESNIQPQIIIKKHIVTRENFDDNIGKTLAGLMDMDTVQRSLQNKTLIVKVVERTYDHSTGDFNRTVSFVYGHMQLVNGGMENQQWTFVLHNPDASTMNDTPEDNQSSIQIEENHEESSITTVLNNGDSANHNKDLNSENPWTTHDEIVSLTIIITIDKNGRKSTKVSLSRKQTEAQCHICNKEYKSVLQMQRHINSVHLTGKPTKCDLCNKSFINHAVLQRHRKLHTTNETWYQCSECLKSFNTAGSLKRHVTIHYPSLRPLQCSVCTHRFTDESSLRKHLLIHTGIRAYSCDICNKRFVNQGDVNFHRRIHDPIKHYKCEVCDQEFSRHSNLVRHSEIHRGESALHRCDICGCGYSFVSSLTRHIVQKHLNQQSKQT